LQVKNQYFSKNFSTGRFRKTQNFAEAAAGQGLTGKIQEYSKTFENLQKFTKTISKFTKTVRKYSKTGMKQLRIFDNFNH
jgi:hypothetical protein